MIVFYRLKKRLWYRFFPVNFGTFLRTAFLQNTSGRLLPHNIESDGSPLNPYSSDNVVKSQNCNILKNNSAKRHFCHEELKIIKNENVKIKYRMKIPLFILMQL